MKRPSNVSFQEGLRLGAIEKDSFLDSCILFISVFGSFFSLGLLVWRVVFNISLSEPLQFITSGSEDASIYNLWKFINHQAVYTHPYKIPFSSAYFNWFFYTFYSFCTQGLLSLFSLSDEWIPTLGRLVTLSGCIVGVFVSYRAFSAFFVNARPSFKILLLSLSIFLFTGPLIGFWAITVRPDVPAFCLEVLAFTIFITNYNKHNFRAYILFILVSYFAWSFKQANVGCFLGTSLFLAVNRKWKGSLIVFLSMILLIGATLSIGGENYKYNTIISLTKVPFQVSHSLRPLGLFVIKTFPVVFFCGLSLVLVLFSKRRADYFSRATLSQLSLIIFCTTFALSFLTSMKIGAGDNYYFTSSFFTCLVAIDIMIKFTKTNKFKKFILWIWCTTWIVFIAVVATVLVGVRGRLSVRNQHASFVALKECLRALPKPVYIEDNYANLPWMSQQNVHFVLSWDYGFERTYERASEDIFEKGGLGGLIRKGYFKSLVLFNTSSIKEFDGTSLSAFAETNFPSCSACSDYKILVRKDQSV